MELEASQTTLVDPVSGDGAAGASAPAVNAPSSTLAQPENRILEIPTNAVRVGPVDGVVRLPAGTRLDAIRLSGSDLVVTLPDGQVLVIADGALHIPRIQLGPINIPATTVAALIAKQEPEPADGAPQGSGGNFIETPGDIGDAFALGDLLAATDFRVTQADDTQFVPEAFDHKPEILIVTPDQPLGSRAATASVNEAGLPARGSEPAGSDASATTETITGTLRITALNLPYEIAVNGAPITEVGQTVSTSFGVITITGITPGAIDYSYSLIDNTRTPDAIDTIIVTVKDRDGDVETATLAITPVDDSPTARADTDNVAPGLYNAQIGNVITGAGTTSGTAGADTRGADGVLVTGIRLASNTIFTGPGAVVEGQYGRLLLRADGTYSYVRSAETPGGVADVFTYQLTDGDGDTSSATLTINIGDAAVGLTVPSAGDEGTRVDEAGLPASDGVAPGSREGDDSYITVGEIPFEAPDGPASIMINGVVVTGEGQEIQLATGTFIVIAVAPDFFQYVFILTDNVNGVASQPVNVTITDLDGDTVSASFVIDILDDAPTARNDADNLQAGSAGVADGNVLTGLGGTDANTDDGRADTPGADGAVVTGISFAGNSGIVGGATQGAYGALSISADGRYVYALDNANTAVRGLNDSESLTETFTYTITDGDGDQSSATLTVTIRGQDDIVTISGLDVAGTDATIYEASLPDGSAPDSSALIATGSFAVDGPDGILGITIGGQTLFDGNIVTGLTISTALGTLTITGFDGTFDPAGELIGGTVGYSYELSDNTLLHSGTGDDVLTDSFAVTVIDSDGSMATSILDVAVIDDNPTARAAPAVTVAEDTAAISGNLLANDSAGSDGALVTSVDVGGVIVTVAATGTTSYSNAGGTYSFQANGDWTFAPVISSSAVPLNADFSYTITDGDGDRSTAQQQIRVIDGTNPQSSAPVDLALDDQRLVLGSTPSAIQPISASGQIRFTPGSDSIVSIAFGDLSGLGGGLTWTRESNTEIIGWDNNVPVVILDLAVAGNTTTITAILESNYAQHADVSADDLAILGSVSVLAIDADGDRALGTVNLSISDDVPTIVATTPSDGLLTVDESDLATNATADFAGIFNLVKGADVGTVTYAFEVTLPSGLIDLATGARIMLQSLGNVVEGRLLGSPHIVAFRLSVGSDGQATLDQMRAVRHENASNTDDTASLSSRLIRLVATVTDSDGDQATATADVGNTLVFRDDGPSIEVAAIDTNSILLITQDSETPGAAFDVATADLSSSFAVAASSYGADGASGAGAVLWSYALALGTAPASTGLSSNGVPVTLAVVAGDVVGSAGGDPVFSVAVNAATGLVTLTQFAEIDHPSPGSSGDYAGQLTELAANLIELRGTATIFDRDGDSRSDTVAVDLGGNIHFADDGPSISATGNAPLLVVDETNFYVNATSDLSGLFASTLNFGADGSGDVVFALGVAAGPSGLTDSLTGEAIVLTLLDGVIYGRTSTHEALRISVAADGAVTFDQSRAILHAPDAGPDQTTSFVGTNLITLTAIATDGDGDKAQSTADITGHFIIHDDAPLAQNDADNVARDGQKFADGNVLTGLSGSDSNGVDGSPDRSGSDGGLMVSGVVFGATAGSLGSALAGEYGSLTLEADGSYRYELDPADAVVIALGIDQTISDTFAYTVIDADGDVSTASITITITGADDFPIARADTNWVLDMSGGSDPSTTGNVLQNISHPGAPMGIFADVADNDPNSEPITVTSPGSYVGLYGTLVIGADGAYTYTLDGFNVAVDALDSGQTLVDSFAYTISDGLLSVASTLSVTIFGTNDAPTVGTSIARVSEEGLPGGIADPAPNATLDTTNSATFSGTLAISDLDVGQNLTATLGDPGAVLTAGGLPVTWTGVGTGTLIGSVGTTEVIRVALASGGAYNVTLAKAVDHSGAAIEDLKEFDIPVAVSDGTVTTVHSSAIHVVIEDDAPTAVGETGSSAQPTQDVNTLFVLDFSASIDDGELDIMLSAVKSALAQLDASASGVLGIEFVVFSSGSFASPAFTNAADANLYLDSLNPATGGERPSQAAPPEGIGQNTNYSGAIQTALASFDVVPGASNQVFFLSDGNPNQQVQFGGFPPSVINSLTPAIATAWNTFVDNNAVNVTAIGIDNNPLQPLSIQRLRDVDLNDAPGNDPILVSDFDDLVSTLLGVIVPSAIFGDLDANDAYGSDGGRLLSITVGTATYSWDGASSIAVSSGGAIAGTSLTAIETPVGGALTFNFATGQYVYLPPTPITVTATETFAYTLVDGDGDGDTATAELSVTITAAIPPIVLDLDGDGVEFLSSAAGVRFDYDGDGVVESTAWSGPDDGLLVLDKNGNGKIDSGSELAFGYGGLTDLQGLAADYDSNRDGKFDATDAAFVRFGIWRDADSDGVTDAGELQSLTTAGIASISLVSDGLGYVAADGQVTVKGETVFVRIDGSTGKAADASFATNFANDNQRALSAVANGVSTAMLAAGLVAAMPLAAKIPEDSRPDRFVTEEIQTVTTRQMVEPTTSDQIAEWDPSLDAPSSELDLGAFVVATSLRHSDDNDRPSVAQHGESDAAATGPDLAALLQSTTTEALHNASHGDAFAATVDQSAVMLIARQQGGEPVVNDIKALVADVMEGQTVDLDALLGTNAPSENRGPETKLQDVAAETFVTSGGQHSFGNAFMPDLMEQQVMAQMDHTAATGHS